MTPLRRALGVGLPEWLDEVAAWWRTAPPEFDEADRWAEEYITAAQEIRLMMARIAQLERDIEKGAAHEP